MAIACSVCAHPGREEIDLSLAADRVTVRGCAARWRLDKSAVWRHRARHLPLRLAKATEAAEVASANRLLMEMDEAQRAAKDLTARAAKAQDLRVALAGIKTNLDALALLSKVAGLIQTDLSISLAIVSNPDWVALRDDLIRTLARHPAAHREVIAVLERHQAA